MLSWWLIGSSVWTSALNDMIRYLTDSSLASMGSFKWLSSRA